MSSKPQHWWSQNIQSFCEEFQEWQLHHFPRQAVPTFISPFHKEIIPDTQLERSLAQLQAISSSRVAGFLRQEAFCLAVVEL